MKKPYALLPLCLLLLCLAACAPNAPAATPAPTYTPESAQILALEAAVPALYRGEGFALSMQMDAAGDVAQLTLSEDSFTFAQEAAYAAFFVVQALGENAPDVAADIATYQLHMRAQGKETYSATYATAQGTLADITLTDAQGAQHSYSAAGFARHYPEVYAVGEDLPAGEYLMQATDLGDFSLSGGDALAQERSFRYRAYVTLAQGQSFAFNECIATRADYGMPYLTDGAYVDGMYKVGTDLPAGDYLLTPFMTGAEAPHVALYADSAFTAASLLEETSPTQPYTLTLTDGQYVQLLCATLTAQAAP